eukprot:4781326-Alexandrium_andersonii.AAC.1
MCIRDSSCTVPAHVHTSERSRGAWRGPSSTFEVNQQERCLGRPACMTEFAVFLAPAAGGMARGLTRRAAWCSRRT